MGRCWTVSVAIVGVILALIVGHLLVKLGFTNTFTAVDSATCTRVGHGLFHGSEDVALVRRGRYLVSSGDVIPLLEGAPRIPAGSIVCVDMGGDAVSAFTVPLTGLPAGVAFQPHGLSYSNETGLLFAVSHGLSAGGLSRVVILELSGADAEDPREMSLRYRGSVTSPFFGNGALNNLAAGFVPGELFVSEWLQVPTPLKGSRHPDTPAERLAGSAQAVLQVVSPGTRLFRCTFVLDDQAPAACTVAARGFYGANGVSRGVVAGRGRRVFVADTPGISVVILRYEDGGVLTPEATVPLDFPIDNCDWDDEGQRLLMGTIPAVWKNFAYIKGWKDIPVPGGLGIMSPREGGEGAGGWAVDIRALVHDGSKLSAVSAAGVWGSRVLLGSPWDTAVLVCPLPQ